MVVRTSENGDAFAASHLTRPDLLRQYGSPKGSATFNVAALLGVGVVLILGP